MQGRSAVIRHSKSIVQLCFTGAFNFARCVAQLNHRRLLDRLVLGFEVCIQMELISRQPRFVVVTFLVPQLSAHASTTFVLFFASIIEVEMYISAADTFKPCFVGMGHLGIRQLVRQQYELLFS